jgi:uncharacterized membrane protein
MEARTKLREKHYRSILKTISWRITGTIDTIIIAYFITRELTWALAIGSIEVFTKLILYYVHERLWLKLKIGLVDPPDYQI